jgi:hypothetical protein
MQKIASPTELQAELCGLIAFIHGHGPDGKPDRRVIASKLRELADRVAGTVTRKDLFKAKDVHELFDLLTRFLGKSPTVGELRDYTNTVLGPWDIPKDLLKKCRRQASIEW